MRASSWVEVLPPGAPQAVRMQLRQLRDAVLRRQLGADVPTRTDTAASWVPAHALLAACVDFQPTRAGLFIVFVGLVAFVGVIAPLVVWGENRSVFFTMPIGFVLAVAAIITVVATPTLRTRTFTQLLRTPVVVVVPVLLFVIGWGIGGAVTKAAARSRFQAALLDPDPCAAGHVAEDPVVVKELSSTERYNTRANECLSKTIHEECGALSAGVQRGAIPPTSYANPNAAALAERLASHRLTSADLMLDEKMACGDALWDQLVAEVANNLAPWKEPKGEGPVEVSLAMAAALNAKGVKGDVAKLLRDRAETKAKTVANAQKLEDLAPTAAACDQLTALAVEPGAQCKALSKRHTALKKQADAIAEAQQKRDDALAEAQERRDTKREQAGFVQCMAQCNRSRSASQLQAESACREQCMGDLTCISTCHQASNCEADCALQYPAAMDPL